MNIGELIETKTKKNPNKIFLYFEDERICYQDFNDSVNRTANFFRRMGVNRGEMVAIMLPNLPAFLYTWMGLNKISAIEVPININFKEPEVKYILQHSEASGIVIHEDYYPLLSKINKKEISNLKHIIVYTKENPPSGTINFFNMLNESPELTKTETSEEEPAACIYTSGTTDKPKGVLNSHRNWILTGQAYAYTVGITEEDRVMTPNPLFHANAQVYSTMGALSAEASLILLKHFSASRIIEQAREYGATKMVLVQAVTPWIWNRPRREDDGDNPVRTMIAGNVATEIYRNFEKRFNLRIQTIYSLTESVMGIMGPREVKQERKSGGLGIPMEHPDPAIKNYVKIVDNSGIELPRGKQGEIIICNPVIMIGYLKDKEKTNQSKRTGWIYTGDIGYQDEDGYFYFVGRKKEVLRRRGELISPAEIEAAINCHPAVAESAVIGVPTVQGPGEEEIKAYIRLKADAKVTPQEIIFWCGERLAEFKVPRYMEFRKAFPKSAIGRIQKRVLMSEKKDLTEGCYDKLAELAGL